MKGWRDYLRFVSVNRRDPVAMVLAGAAAILVLFFTIELVKGVLHTRFIHHLWHETAPLPAAQAGIDMADFSADGTEVSGWAPPGAAVRVLERGREIAEDQADDTGQWDLSFADDEQHEFRILTVFWRASGKMAGEIGRLSLLASGPSADDAYLWWRHNEGGEPQLLQSPDAGEKGNLFLLLAQWRDGEAPLLEGQATPHGLVQLYADNQLVGAATADADGRWILSLVAGDKKTVALRLDEIYDGSVHERRSYKLAWPEGKDANIDQPVLMQTNNDNWVVGEPAADGHVLLTLFSPEAGTPMSPGNAIPGQVIPVTADK